MMDTPSGCGFDESVAPRYLAGRLTDAEAEAFEAHYFACERCWAEVRAAQDLRAALVPKTRPASRRPWVPLAAAAALLGALGTWMLVRPGAEGERVFRAGRKSELDVSLSPGDAGVGVAWPVTPGARAYRVRVVTAEGALVTEREVAASPALLEKLPTTLLYVSVQALGPDGQVLAASSPRKLQGRPGMP